MGAEEYWRNKGEQPVSDNAPITEPPLDIAERHVYERLTTTPQPFQGRTEETTVTCCYIVPDSKESCKAPAEWELVDGPSPDSATYACEAHVWALVSDKPRIAISSYPVADWQYTLLLERSAVGEEHD